MEDYFQGSDASKTGPILRLPETSFEDTLRADDGLATSPSTKRPAPGRTWTTPLSTLDMTEVISPEIA
jgi:hypothetical protein